ncbi:methylmalonyl-CoA mutase family protein, partial [Flammeovirga aprica]
MSEKLFSAFKSASKKAWKDKVIQDLKGGDFDHKLIWNTENEMKISPYFNREDREYENEKINELKHLLPHSENEGLNWQNFQDVVGGNSKEANENALYLLERGVEGIVFNIGEIENPNLDLLFEGINLEMIWIGFKNVLNPQILVDSLIEYVIKSEFSLSQIRGFINYDPLSQWTINGEIEETSFQKLADLISLTGDMPMFKVMSISSLSFVNSGANHIQEVAFTLNGLVEYIEQLAKYDLTPNEILPNVIFQMGICGDYFHEIAKFRAFRLLVLEIAKL